MSVYEFLKKQTLWRGGFVSNILDYILSKQEMRDIAYYYLFKDSRLELPGLETKPVVATQKTAWLYGLIATPVPFFPKTLPGVLHPYMKIKTSMGRELYRVSLHYPEHVVEFAFHFSAQMFLLKQKPIACDDQPISLSQKWNISAVLPHQSLYESLVAYEIHMNQTYEIYPQEVRKRVRKRCCTGERWSLIDLTRSINEWFSGLELPNKRFQSKMSSYCANYLWCKWTMDELNQILQLTPRE